MFDPANLQVVRDSRRPESSFVGIRKRPDTNPEFCLPLGFDDFPVDSATKVRDIFFSLYRTLDVFQRDLSDRVRDYKEERDTGYQTTGGASFTTRDGEKVTLVSKISMLEAVLKNYDELRIFRILNRPRRSEEVDYSQIHKYLDKAVFLENDAAHIDEMVLPQPTLSYGPADIVRMFCFIYLEVMETLGEGDTVRNDVSTQAATFRYEHLHPDSSLFTNSHDRTIRHLKKILNKIDFEVGYKDSDYWHFYDAIETFLYGQLNPNKEGIMWGISTFSPVWEDMCITWIFENDYSTVIYADTDRRKYSNSRLGDGQRVYIEDGFDQPFYFERGQTRRYLRPDIVRARDSPEDRFDRFFSVEWKDSGTCRIKLQEKGDYGHKLFRILADKIQVRGGRPPSGTTETFRGVPRSRLERAKREIISKYFDDTKPWIIFDIKYVPPVTYVDKNLPSKIEKDVEKQLVYEYALQNGKDVQTRSTFDIPCYFDSSPEPISKTLEEDKLPSLLARHDMNVGLVDFMRVQRAYLEALY
jgi:hypothetical protein